MENNVYSTKSQTRSVAVIVLVVIGTVCFFGMFGAHFEGNVIPPEIPDTGSFQQVAFAPGCVQQVAFASNGCLTGQFAAMQSNGLKLPMGVTLVGKGMVTQVVPGSKAARAGITTGDVINRINGK
jgi:PDZ domain-containing protein